MKKFVILFVLMSAFFVHSQVETLTGHSFFRDQMQQPGFQQNGPIICDVGFEKDTIKTSIGKKLKSHFMDNYLFEVHDKNVNLYISPVVNLQLGQNILEKDEASLFQNTRGFYVKGELLRNFSFSSAFVENQARFSPYETNYISSHGEFYSSQQQNGVVSGGGRTKPFKEGGFDYAFAIGSFLYKPIEALEIRAGNAPAFIGSGYRSLILSDHSYQSPSLDIKYTFLKKWSYRVRRTRLLNLNRKPAFSTVEAYYQPKAAAMHSLSYEVNDKINLSFFENSIWSKGDTLTTMPHGLYYVPLPFLGLSQDENFTLYGLNASEILGKKVRLYQQIVLSGFQTRAMGMQLGVRLYNLIPNSMLQLEYNKVGAELYASETPAMSYTHYNLPLAHPKGQGFDELVVRANISIKRFYGESKTICYWLKNYNERDLLPMDVGTNSINDFILHQQVEIGYRINPKINFCAFARGVYRKSDVDENQMLIHVGLSTNLFNSYNDY
jgi:hypothetical protein